ncbi:hypothetical protein OG21DRAFT_1484198 [Imleria badia]|nr:hypothetical protein OG21DRAFT_1484198 [Imleria badia]
MAALQRDQLNRLCSSSETLENAQSILCLANAKTRPGSGFVVKNTIAIPAVCTYLASEQLNTGKVSLQSAMSAACVAKVKFSDILKTTLVDAYRVQAREHAIACMEDAEAALPQVDILKERYGANVVLCAILYWLRCTGTFRTGANPPIRYRRRHLYKAVVTILDKRCDAIAEQIKPHFKSPMKSTIRPQTMTRRTSTQATSPSKKRANDSVSFLETPTKKRRVDYSSPIKPRTSNSPTKRLSAVTTAAFHALKGSPTKLPVGQESESPGAGPSTHAKAKHHPLDQPSDDASAPSFSSNNNVSLNGIQNYFANATPSSSLGLG